MVPSNCSHTLAVFVRFALSTHILSTARGHAVHFSSPEGLEADLLLFKGNKQTSPCFFFHHIPKRTFVQAYLHAVPN